jgi:hypothetical protein
VQRNGVRRAWNRQVQPDPPGDPFTRVPFRQRTHVGGDPYVAGDANHHASGNRHIGSADRPGIGQQPERREHSHPALSPCHRQLSVRSLGGEVVADLCGRVHRRAESLLQRRDPAEQLPLVGVAGRDL